MREDFENGLHGGSHRDGREHVGVQENHIRGWVRYCVRSMLEDLNKLKIPRETDDEKEGKYLSDYDDFLNLWKRRRNADGTLPPELDVRTLFLRNPFGSDIPVKVEDEKVIEL